MTSGRQYAALALLLVGLLAVPNGMWLFPNEGDRRYTYERTTVVVEDGTLAYRDGPPREHEEFHGFRRIDCRDLATRDCAFDRYLLREGPVTVASAPVYPSDPAYTRIDGSYYHRTVESVGGNTTVDLERVPPETLRARLATEVPPAAPDAVADQPPVYRAVATGDPVTSFRQPHEADLGRVYVQNGSYYAAVVTGESTLDRPLLNRTTRDLLSFCGAMSAFVLAPLLFAAGSDRVLPDWP